MKARPIWTLAASIVLIFAGIGAIAATAGTQSFHGTRIAVSSSVKHPVSGQSVTLTARVTGIGHAQGKVVFDDFHIVTGIQKLGTGILILGEATLRISTLSVGTHSITASYTFYGRYVSSPALKLTVKPAATTTTLTSDSTIGVDASVQLTAKVTAKAPSHTVPTGTVMFLVDRKKVGSGTLRRGKATFTLTFQGSLAGLAVGKHSTTAAFGGSSTFTGSTSLPQTLKVGKVATKTKLAVAPNPSVFGQQVTFTATVTGGAGVPKGSVQFKDGGVTVATGDLNGDGVAEVTVSTLGVGLHSITANTYSGTPVVNGDLSRAVVLTVNQAGTTTTAVSKVTESPAGLSVTFTITVTPSPDGAGTPTGTVTLALDGTGIFGTGALTDGKVTVTTTVVKPGQTVTVTYAGDANFKGSSSTVKVTS